MEIDVFLLLLIKCNFNGMGKQVYVNVSLLVVFFSKVNVTLHQIERLKGYYYQTINNDIFCDKGEIGC